MSATQSPSGDIRLFGLDGIPDVQPGDHLAEMIGQSIDRTGLGLEPSDILIITHKIVSKSEGQLVDLSTVTPSEMALAWANRYGKDPRQVEVVFREAIRIVRMDRGVLITETKHGFICANAAVDASNVAPDTVCLLPEDPDASAARLRQEIGARFGFTEENAPAVIISDSFGRPWRQGIVNVAIGVAGIAPLADYRGQFDAAGYELHVSVLAVADELAAAAELVMNKLDARPVVVIRGYAPPTGSPAGTGRDMVLDSSRDLFR